MAKPPCARALMLAAAAALSLVLPQLTAPAVAVPLARPTALHQVMEPALLRVKIYCRSVCVQWKPCPPPNQPQPPGCWVGTYPYDLHHLDQYCIKHRKFCGNPPGTHPPRAFSPSAGLLSPRIGRLLGGFRAPINRSPRR